MFSRKSILVHAPILNIYYTDELGHVGIGQESKTFIAALHVDISKYSVSNKVLIT